jgi:DNA-binding transcriptional LysR family regulator
MSERHMPAGDIDPGLLRTLVAIRDTGGFSAAARELNLTQSAVSHQIRRLEERVGRPLLNRTTRQVSFNEDGRELLHRATRLLDAMDSLHRHLRPPAIEGVVRFGIPDAVLGDRLPTLFAQFSRLFPSVRLEVSAGMSLDLRRSVAAGELDLAVVMDAEPIEPNRLLRREPLVWVAGDTFRIQQAQPLPLALPCIHRHV